MVSIVNTRFFNVYSSPFSTSLVFSALFIPGSSILYSRSDPMLDLRLSPYPCDMDHTMRRDAWHALCVCLAWITSGDAGFWDR